ncbi:MAG: ABC transporter substrate-binding protein [Anaerolineaceae bacterium]|nr:ABC transporter substrate-binding protein [Anaerolineaceae bacterium]
MVEPTATAAAQAAQETPMVEEETDGRTIVAALSEAPVSLDPADHRNRPSETVIRNMFDGLVTRDTRSGVHMQLAESIDWTDNQTLAIQLRQDVKFHDGSQMSADDVVFTFERIINENQIEYPEVHSSPRKGLIAPLTSIEKTGDYSVVMHFNAPWPPAMQLLVHQQIVPKAYIEKVGSKGFVEKPIGTGPFKFVSASDGLEEIILERFGDYYGGSPDLAPVSIACVDRVIFKVIPEASTRAAALLAGEVQIIQSVPSDLVSRLNQNDNVTVKTAPGTQPKWIELNVTKPPFDDVKVRQALNYALDKNLIIQEIFNGRAVALPGALSPFNNFVNQSLNPYPYDLVMAQNLLKEAGWTDTNGDGIVDKNGQPLSFTIDTLEEHRSLAEAVASLFQEAGIDASVRFWEYSVVKPMLQAGERQAYLDDWGDSAFDPVGHFEAKWHGYLEGQSYGRGNFSGYNNERVNELILQGETTVDTAERQKIYDEAQQLVYVEAPAVFLILPEEVEASLINVMNWEPASDSRINLHDVCLNQ